MASCTEKFGDTIEGFIGGQFSKVGRYVSSFPKRTIAFAILVTVICGGGFARWTTENRADKLWVPQGTTAETETELYEQYFRSTSRFNQVIVQSATSGENVLTMERLEDAMKMHEEIETSKSTVDGTDYTLTDLCVFSPGSCTSVYDGVCQCLVSSILKAWNYDLTTLQSDSDYLATLNTAYAGNTAELQAALGNPTFDDDGNVQSAEAFTISYILKDRSAEAGSDENGSEADPINEEWEDKVFLSTLESVPDEYSTLSVDYFAGRSFSDEFGGAITGDLALVQISYVVVFVFLGATMGNIRPGKDSRWTMSLAALVLVGLSTGAGFGVSAAFGLFFGPVHSLLPFILLGIGVDDAFVIVNAFNRERKVARSSETNDDLMKRSMRALARAGASITVTSLTDLVAFGISASSRLPALASFCAYASIGIIFLWAFASTFFTATLVLDERRQRDNRRECLCCLTRKKPLEEDGDGAGYKEGGVSRYFRKYHAPAILSVPGKIVVLLAFSGLLGFGIWGALNLSVEDTQRSFIPSDSYLTDYINTADKYNPDTGVSIDFVFEESSDIFAKSQELANLDSRLTGLSEEAPYIAEPGSAGSCRNVMKVYSDMNGGSLPTSESELVTALTSFVSMGPGAAYARDVNFSSDGSAIDAIRISCKYTTLTKEKSNGDIIDDAEKQIEAMDATREMVEGWGDDLPSVFPYSEKFIAIEGFKIIRRELFLNVGLALAAVAIIVFFTVASPITSLLITLNVAFCIIEILGFMYALGIAIDSVSVINIVLAVGLSIDYSAHIGHCFMLKGGSSKNGRVLEALADIGAAVLSGATTTFLAVVVLLFSSSYVFVTLSKQFALTVGLGIIHGLVLLPVLLSLLGPKAFSSAEMPSNEKTEADSNGSQEYSDDA